jgi:prolyl-tRNA editing enzyme YbaK/EbsC (Cys-tRNA(Pro) deacylase)
MERDQFIAESSQRLLGHIVGGAVSSGETPNLPGCVDIAVKAAAALFDRLTADGHL